MVGGPKEKSESGKGYRGGSPQTIPPGDTRPSCAGANALSRGGRSAGFLFDSLKQLLPHARRRDSRLSGERHQRKNSASSRKRACASRAGGKMKLYVAALFAFQRAKREEIELFLNWMLVCQLSARFKIPIAERIRVFTVPRGSPVRVAISVCVMPSKYASSTTSR